MILSACAADAEHAFDMALDGVKEEEATCGGYNNGIVPQKLWWVLALALDWLSSRANNVKGGRRSPSTRTVEPEAPAGG